MVTRARVGLWLLLAGFASGARADAPVASYIFPAGGQRGTTVAVRVGGLNLNSKANFEILGPGVDGPAEVRRTETLWLEGPLLPLPDSQQAEDYPKDYAGRIAIAEDALSGPRAWRIWTAQGASGSLPFVVGELPEIIENESDSADSRPQTVTLPLTINGRIFPREDVDRWSFPLRAGVVVSARVDAPRLGSPLDPWFEAIDDRGLRLAESAPAPDCDARLVFAAPRDGTYTIKIHDVNVKGGQAYTYRLTLTAGPSITAVFPLGGRRGTTVTFWREGLGLIQPESRTALPAAGAGRGPRTVYIPFAEGESAAVEIDDLPEAVESEPNDTIDQAAPLATPSVANGRIQEDGDRDLWMVPMNQGQSYRIELRAKRLGSRLDALLSVLDAGGKELAHAESGAALPMDPALAAKLPARAATGVGPLGDPGLTFRPAKSARHFIQIKDRFRSRGGTSLGYRLVVRPAPPDDFQLFVASDTLSLPRGGAAKLKVEVERPGTFSGPITVAVDGLPPGVSVVGTSVGPTARSVELTFKAEPSAPTRSARLTIRGTAEIGGATCERVATRIPALGLPEIESVRLAVVLPTPFLIGGPVDYNWWPRGSVRHRRYTIVRNGFQGQITVQLADRQARHLQGITGPIVVVPEGSEEFDYAVTLPPWMEIGRTSRTVVVASGVVREPDGDEYEVSFSSPKAETQIVAVVGPGRLGLEAARASTAIAPGQTSEVPVRIARGEGIDGPVRVEIVPPSWLRSLSAEPLVLDKAHEEGVLRLECGPHPSPLGSTPLRLRATALVEADAVTAEAWLTLVMDGVNPRQER
jgi:hypothetical protein